MKKTTLFVALATALLISGCTLPQVAVTKGLDGADARPSHEVATLHGGSSKANPSNQMQKLWFAGIESVDGKPWPKGVHRLQLPPGTYKLKMWCTINAEQGSMRVNQGKGADKTEERTVTVLPNVRYYPWAVYRETARRGNESNGTCSTMLETRDPDLGR